MAQMANITAYDGASTPALHTLLPQSVSRDKEKVTAIWRESALGVPTNAQVRVTMTLERQKSGVYRLSSRTVVPVQEVVTGSNSAGYSAAPRVAYENTIDMVAFFHERSDVTGRRLVRQLAINIANGVTTSVAPVTTGPVADLFDLLNAPV